MSYKLTNSGGQITYPHIPALDGATKWTVSLWMKDVSAGFTAFQQHDGVDDGIYYYPYSDYHSYIAAAAGYSGLPTEFSNTHYPSESGWHHYLIAYDGSAYYRLAVWKDGVAVSIPGGYEFNSSTSIGNTGTNNFLTCSSWSGTLDYPAYVAEVALWVGNAYGATEAGLLFGGDSPMTIGTPEFYAPYTADGNDIAGSRTGSVATVTLDVDHPSVDPPPGGGGGSSTSRKRIIVI